MGRRFAWTEKREEAAMLVAQDDLTNLEISKRVGISRHCLDQWKRRAEFQGRVTEITAAMSASIRGRGIAELQNRVEALNERWNLMQKVIAARAGQYADVPGGDTGLLVRTGRVKGDGRRAKGRGNGGQMAMWEGEEGREEEEEEQYGEGEYVVDVGLLKELREHEKQAAQELGQWQAERENEGAVLVREYVGVVVEKV